MICAEISSSEGKLEFDKLQTLITASADRTIKLWDPRNIKSNACFQTIVGHEGTVLDMVYISKVSALVSSSTDRTMRIWNIDPPSEKMLYPRFQIF